MTRRLRKIDVERLLAGYDDDPIEALTIALRIVLESPSASWSGLVTEAPLSSERRAALLRADQAALDALATELNELRTL